MIKQSCYSTRLQGHYIYKPEEEEHREDCYHCHTTGSRGASNVDLFRVISTIWNSDVCQINF